MSKAKQLIGIMRKLANREDIKVWTWRLTFPNNIKWDDVKEFCNRVDVLINAYHANLPEISVDDLSTYLNTCRNSYAALLLKPQLVNDVSKIASIIYRLWELVGEEGMCRVGISFGDYIDTPYYPLSTMFNEGVSASLRYVDILMMTEPKSWLSKVSSYVSILNKKLNNLCDSVSIRFLGFDLSLSPWLTNDESIVRLIERYYLSGRKFPSIGTASAINSLNNFILNLVKASGVRALGFNEVMLPLAEDEVLKERVYEGNVRLHDLINLSTYCIAGLDMVAIPASKEIIESIIKDLITVYKVKGKVIGMRIIPTTSNYEIKLAGFGKVPIVKS